jgi:hypothetical protein
MCPTITAVWIFTVWYSRSSQYRTRFPVMVGIFDYPEAIQKRFSEVSDLRELEDAEYGGFSRISYF